MNVLIGLRDPRILIRTGLVFLILASLSRWLLHPNARFSGGLVDMLTGLLYGVSIGCLLLGIWRNRRRHAA